MKRILIGSIAAIGVLSAPLDAHAQRIEDVHSYTVLGNKNEITVAPIDDSDAPTIDTAHLRVVYRMYFRTDRQSDPTYLDNIVLLVGTRFTQSIPAFYRYIDSTYTVKKQSLDTRMIPDQEVLRNLSTGTIRVENRLLYLPHQTISYRELAPRFDWRLQSGTGDVCGNVCHKATAAFRGREWSVWFAPEIPVDAGPWKFHGLPGLILRAESADGDYVFVAVAIREGAGAAIYRSESITYHLSREKVRSRIASFCQAPLSFLGGTPHAQNIYSAGGKQLDDTWTIDYNPIELE